MKIRNIPYGYMYQNGEIVLHPKESKMVDEIIQLYLKGKSLLEIASQLNKRAVEYMEGVIGWNKARLKRILEDERYLGRKGYPMIIDEEVYKKIQKIKDGKNVQKNTDRKAEIFQINSFVCCPICQDKLHRVCDSRFKKRIKWICGNSSCKTVIAKEDEELLGNLTDILYQIIAEPSIIQEQAKVSSEPSMELRKLNNEVDRMFDNIEIDKELLRQKLLEATSLRYIELGIEVCKTQRLKDIFVEAKPLKDFSAELFDKTVKEIRLNTDGKVKIILVNNQEIGEA